MRSWLRKLSTPTVNRSVTGLVQRSAVNSVPVRALPHVVDGALRSPGQQLDPATRAFMEPRFGRDFSHVRVHTNASAMESARATNALAFTVGHDIVFSAGRYRPQSDAGRQLLAHELTHVVQQSSGGVAANAEAQAGMSARQVGSGGSIDASAMGGAPVSLQRAGEEGQTATPAPAGVQVQVAPNEPAVDEFDFDKTTIPPQHLDRLTALRKRLIQDPSSTVVLTGHTDTVGTEKYNEDLGLRRARAVRDFLTTKNGVPDSRTKVESHGELEPAAGQPPAQLDPNPGVRDPKNRRVEIRVIGGAAVKGWTFDPRDPAKKPPINLTLPPDYKGDVPKPGGTGPVPTSPEAAEKGGPKIERTFEVDPLARDVQTAVQVTWESKSGVGKRLNSEISFTIHVGSHGLTQLESDLTVFKKKLAESTLGGVIKELTFSLGLNPAFNFDRNAATKLVSEFEIKAKASLEADLVIPKTSIKLPFEITESVGPDGKSEWGLKFKIKF